MYSYLNTNISNPLRFYRTSTGVLLIALLTIHVAFAYQADFVYEESITHRSTLVLLGGLGNYLSIRNNIKEIVEFIHRQNKKTRK